MGYGQETGLPDQSASPFFVFARWLSLSKPKITTLLFILALAN
jgi:hypothetical protein